MKTKLLAALLICSLALNAWLGLRVWNLTSVYADKTLDVGSDAGDDEALESARELAFLRELISRWSTFQSSTYLQSQVNLLPLLAPALADDRKKEIQRLSKRLKNQNIEQTSKLTSLTEDRADHFHASVSLRLTEEKKQTPLRISQTIETEKEIPNLENAWGFRAKELSTETSVESDRTKTVTLQLNHPALLSFPCAVRGVSSLDSNEVKFKLVTVQESELVLTALKAWTGSRVLQVECDQIAFDFELRTGTPSLRYYAVEKSESHAPPASKTAHPNRDQVKRSLERELGFEIEESGK